MSNWGVGIARNSKKLDKPLTKRGIKKFLCKSVDNTFKNGDFSKEFWLVLMDNTNSESKYVAITGNGPNSQKHAYQIAALPDLYNVCELCLGFLHKISIRKKDDRIECDELRSKIMNAMNECNFWENMK